MRNDDGIDLLYLLAHEMFHHWNNGENLLESNLEPLHCWFQEGFEELLAELENVVGSDLALQVHDIIVDGQDVELPADILGECWTLTSESHQQVDFGFDLNVSPQNASPQEEQIIGVESDSAAKEAGLEDGQRFLDVTKTITDEDRQALAVTIEQIRR